MPKVGLTQSEADANPAPAARAAESYDSPTNTVGPANTIVAPSDGARPGIFFYTKGIEAFKKKQYAFAIEMYQVAASYAYKPAQYNLAVIYARGQGVAVDMPNAMAWATIAAERGDRHYVAARDAIHSSLTPEQVVAADTILASLTPQYADETAMRRAKSRWKDARLSATGSRLGYVGTLKVGAPGSALGSSQKTSPSAKESASSSQTAWDATGGKQVDGSIAYRQLQATDNPYDSTQRTVTGTVAVGEIETPAETDAKLDTPAETEDADSGKE